MKNLHKTEADEAWDSRDLGASEKYVRKLSPEKEKDLDDTLDLQVVSIRLQKSLIKEFKRLAQYEGVGYQPLMRQVLTHYINKSHHKHLKTA